MTDLVGTEPLAYLAGTLLGDAWLAAVYPSHKYNYLCLRVADQDFSVAFVGAIRSAFGLEARSIQDERGYWLVRRYNRDGRFDVLRDFEPPTEAAKASWLRGMFDSEGCAYFGRVARYGPGSYARTVTFTSTDQTTLGRCERYLRELGIDSITSNRKLSAGHLGTKPVLCLRVRSSKRQFERFARLVGSSIGRKQENLERIAASYYAGDVSELRRAMQLQGVAVRIARRDAGGRY